MLNLPISMIKQAVSKVGKKPNLEKYIFNAHKQQKTEYSESAKCLSFS